MTRPRVVLFLTVVGWIAAGILFFGGGISPAVRPAMAETVVLATGWEDGQLQGLMNRVEYSREVAGYFNTSSPPPECGPRYRERPRSGDYSLMMAGYSRAGYAYAYFRVFDQNIPVSPGNRIGYWIYHQEGTAKIAVDGHFTDGTTIRDFGGGVLTDQHGVRIHPGLRQDPMNQWVYVEVDLSPAAGKTLDFIMFAFDNAGDGFTGRFRAYVDDFKVVAGASNACITPVSADHWQGAYYSNRDLSGSPVMVRDDGAGFLNFNWGTGSPGADCGIGTDRFAVRWTRDLFLDSGTYRFTVTADDGFRLYLNGQLKLSAWWDQAPTTYTVDVSLGSGYHEVELEYYENGGGAVANLSWENITGNCIAGVGSDNWQGEYFDNMSLSGSPVMVRDDGDGFLNFDWGGGSPGADCGIGADRFAVRWTREVAFSQGTHRFTVTADDGLRLYVDRILQLERWIDQAPTTYTVDVPLTAGLHEIRLEYYENGGGAVAGLSWNSVTSATTDLYGLGINANYADQNPPAWEIAELGPRWLRSIRYRQDFTPNHGDVHWLVVFNSETIPRGGSESWSAYVNRYAGEVKNIAARNTWINAVEVWNEQDLPDGDHGPGYGRYLNPTDYATLLKTAYQTIKTLPNPPTVVVGGFGAGAPVASQYLDEMKRLWAGSVYFDAVGLHPYLAVVDGIGWPERGTMESNINLLYAHAMGKPLWLTEFGAAIQHLGSKEIIAQYLENCYRLFERLKDGNRRKVAVAFWFAWDDRTHWDPARESHGLVEPNRSGSPDTWRRPAWYRYRELSRR